MGVVTDRQILNELQFDVIEAPDSGATFPSGLWTATEVLEFLNGRQRSFVRRTRAHVARVPLTLAANTESIDLAAVVGGGYEDVYQIVHLVLELAAGTFHEIPPSSTYAADHAIPTWSTTAAAQAVPNAYTTRDTPSVTIRLMPASSVGGTLWIHYIPRPWTLDRLGAGSGETLMVQAELALGVKWGVLAEMLGKPGRAQDPQRAAYAEARAQEFEELTTRLVGGF